jgi:hypothetical protein
MEAMKTARARGSTAQSNGSFRSTTISSRSNRTSLTELGQSYNHTMASQQVFAHSTE